MKKLFFIFIFCINLPISNLLAQTNILMDNLSNGLTFYQCDGYLYDDGGINGNHGSNYDYTVTLCATRNVGDTMAYKRLSIQFEEFDLGAGDVMTAYNGRSILPANQFCPENIYNFTGNFMQNRNLTSTLEDTSGCITLRIVSDGTGTGTGFKGKISCIARCQYPVASLDTFFIKYDIYGNMSIRPIKNGIDSVYSESDSSLTVTNFKSIDFCEGDSIILIANPQFPENDKAYHQSMNNCIYTWSFGDGETDTTYYSNNIVGHKWQYVDGYNLNLFVLDTNQKYINGVGCQSRNTIETRIRISHNPVKTVSILPDMCSGQIFLLNVGYEGNASVVVDSLVFIKQARKMFDSTVFIPDGPRCSPNGNMQCYSSPVFFDQFNPGATITSANDILALCINIEHSAICDLYMYLDCPNGQSVQIKTKAGDGCGCFGIPAGGTTSYGADSQDTSTPCSSPPNLPGIGWWYCLSERRTIPTSPIFENNCPLVTFNDPLCFYGPCQTCDSTDREDTVASATNGYYIPYSSFSNLIGCPMNGEWAIRICDDWEEDNGFVFKWYLELDMSSGPNWVYHVPIDTVIWDGPFIHPQSNTTSQITPPIDSCGTYKYNINIVDDFNCVWDTATSINIACTPIVNLGPDTAVCEKININLDAGNPNASGYLWEPTGDTTQIITFHSNQNSNPLTTYVAQVRNYNGSIYCFNSDSINITVHPAALASFTMDKNLLEGCEPFNFQLFSTSTNAFIHDWTIGNIKSNEPNPSFSFPFGTYDLKLKVISDKGCADSISQLNFINVYKSPSADFGWNPSNPLSTNPTVQFLNFTTPSDNSNKYLWKIQTNLSNDFRENIFGFEPTYNWDKSQGSHILGDYNVTLDAYNINYAPSGLIYECHDTISKIITIINDNLLFPNVLTPNGDGINDVFIIKNLVDGQAYPDNELSIYNRNGKRIFYIEDIRANEELWNPVTTNSPAGTYFYKFVARGPIKNIEYNGAIELIK